MTDRPQWRRGSAYFEGTRVSFLGETYEAKMDMPISIPPIGDPFSKKFWRLVSIMPHHRRGNSTPVTPGPKTGEPTVTVTASRFRELLDLAKGNVPAPRGYITRDMAALSKQGR